jgi:hypothetical protein
VHLRAISSYISLLGAAQWGYYTLRLSSIVSPVFFALDSPANRAYWSTFISIWVSLLAACHAVADVEKSADIRSWGEWLLKRPLGQDHADLDTRILTLYGHMLETSSVVADAPIRKSQLAYLDAALAREEAPIVHMTTFTLWVATALVAAVSAKLVRAKPNASPANLTSPDFGSHGMRTSIGCAVSPCGFSAFAPANPEDGFWAVPNSEIPCSSFPTSSGRGRAR